MTDKLTPRQNEQISQTLCDLVLSPGGKELTPEKLKELRRALVNECEAVTAETNFPVFA